MIRARTHFEQIPIEVVRKIAVTEIESKPAIQIRIEKKPKTDAKR